MIAYPTVSDASLSSQRLDAIVVPTNRSPEALDYALALAKTTNAFLLVFCSGCALAEGVTNRIISSGVRGLAVDVPANYQPPLFSGFETDNFPDAILGRAANDISTKRNLGLILGRMAGWSRLLYLDDDITNIRGINQAISFTVNNPVAGFCVSEFPDNSVVRHAERISGEEPGVRLTGSALMINLANVVAFFPRIYNEDWFFLSGMGSRAFYSPFAGTASQRRYNPFEQPLRATSEEFGDLLAEGIVQLTDVGRDYSRSTKSDWQNLIENRKILIRGIRDHLETTVVKHDAAIESLIAAEARLNDIEPQICVDYIAAWNCDLSLFRERFALLPRRDASITHIFKEYFKI